MLFRSVASQKDFRKDVIIKFIAENNIDTKFDIIVGRGGMLKPIEAGAYEVNDEMIKDLISAQYGEHACSLGALVGVELAKAFNTRVIIADPVVTDEMQEIARVSGHPMFPCISTFHCLNQKAVARRYAKEHGKRYEDLNLVIAHVGRSSSMILILRPSNAMMCSVTNWEIKSFGLTAANDAAVSDALERAEKLRFMMRYWEWMRRQRFC